MKRFFEIFLLGLIPAAIAVRSCSGWGQEDETQRDFRREAPYRYETENAPDGPETREEPGTADDTGENESGGAGIAGPSETAEIITETDVPETESETYPPAEPCEPDELKDMYSSSLRTIQAGGSAFSGILALGKTRYDIFCTESFLAVRGMAGALLSRTGDSRFSVRSLGKAESLCPAWTECYSDEIPPDALPEVYSYYDRFLTNLPDTLSGPSVRTAERGQDRTGVWTDTVVLGGRDVTVTLTFHSASGRLMKLTAREDGTVLLIFYAGTESVEAEIAAAFAADVLEEGRRPDTGDAPLSLARQISDAVLTADFSFEFESGAPAGPAAESPTEEPAGPVTEAPAGPPTEPPAEPDAETEAEPATDTEPAAEPDAETEAEPATDTEPAAEPAAGPDTDGAEPSEAGPEPTEDARTGEPGYAVRHIGTDGRAAYKEMTREDGSVRCDPSAAEALPEQEADGAGYGTVSPYDSAGVSAERKPRASGLMGGRYAKREAF